MAGQTELAQKNRKVLGMTLGVTLGMFGFGFALVPLYDVFCEITGLNGKTGERFEGEVAPAAVDRQVRVQFLTANNENMPWQFRPVVKSMMVTPGQPMDVNFFAANPTNHAMVAQAVPSVAPSEGAVYFLKTECFCFEQQPLDGGKETLMPLRFIVDTELPEHISTLTLSYTLFDITDRIENNKS